MAEPFCRDPLIVRPSSLDYAPDCWRRWAAGSLRQEIKAAGWELRDGRRGIGAGVGTAVHEAAAYMLADKMASGALPPLSAVEDVAMDSMREEIAQGVEFDRKFTPTPRIAATQVLAMSKSYWQWTAPGIQPIAIEERMTVPVPCTRQNLILSGQPDTVAVEPNAILDTKAEIRAGNHNRQIGSYSLLKQTVTRGFEIALGIIHWIPRIPIRRLQAMGQPKPQQRELDIALCETMAMDTLRDIDRFVTVWREGDPERNILPGDPAAFPANPQSMLCGSRYCSAHSCHPAHAFCNAWRKNADD